MPSMQAQLQQVDSSQSNTRIKGAIIVSLPIADIVQTEQHNDVYADADPDPIVVARYKGKYYIVDGNHRYIGAKKAGCTLISAVIFTAKMRQKVDEDCQAASWLLDYTEGFTGWYDLMHALRDAANACKRIVQT